MTTTITLELPDGWELAELEPRVPARDEHYAFITLAGNVETRQNYGNDRSSLRHIVRRIKPATVTVELETGLAEQFFNQYGDQNFFGPAAYVARIIKAALEKESTQ